MTDIFPREIFKMSVTLSNMVHFGCNLVEGLMLKFIYNIRRYIDVIYIKIRFALPPLS